MKTARRSFLPLLAIALLCGACQGPDRVRVTAERASYRLAERCADGWFRGLPVPPGDEQLVRNSLADWDRRLKSDEQLLGGVR